MLESNKNEREDSRKCLKCKRCLSKSAFSKDASRKDGLRVYCKQCEKQYHESYYKKNRKKCRSSCRKSYRKMREDPEKLKKFKERKRRNLRRWRLNLTKEQRENMKRKKHNYYEANKERLWTNRRKRQRLLVLQKISGSQKPKCTHCGCNVLEALQINHISPEDSTCISDGKKYGSYHMFYKAILEGRRKTNDLEVACRVCNARHYLEWKFGLKYQIIFLGKLKEERTIKAALRKLDGRYKTILIEKQ